jgi:hypothetical protein
MHCAAQAEYARLAAQAYTPSDAMSQAGVGLGSNQKVQRPRSKNADAETKRVRRPYLFDGGVVLQINPRRPAIPSAWPYVAGSSCRQPAPSRDRVRTIGLPDQLDVGGRKRQRQIYCNGGVAPKAGASRGGMTVESDTLALVERDADPLILAPDDVARPFQWL